ncbi:MAG: hypothetical protein ACRDHP_02040 [Ktedonobacterales bacterium]
MGAVRSGTGRSGAQALPLTRRQQKRARQRQAQQRNQQRPTQPPKPLQPAPPAPSVAPKGKSAQSTGAGKKVSAERKISTTPPGAAQASLVAALPAAAPPRRTLRRPKTLAAAAPATSSAPSHHTSAPVTPAASSRKFPTLARMVAVAAHPDLTDVPAVAEAPEEEETLLPDLHMVSERLDETSADDKANGGAISEALETQPVPAMSSLAPLPARRPVPTRRLMPPEHPARAAVELDASTASESQPHAASGVRPLQEPDLVMSAAAVQVGLGAAAALTGAGLLLTGAGFALWPFTLAAISGGGGWLAYLLIVRARRWAAALLLLAQLGTLAWLLALAGARGALLALAPMLALLALRWLGRGAAYAVALAALALYALAVALQMNGALTPPLVLSSGGHALLDSGAVALGLLGMLLLVSRMHNNWLRAEVRARAGRYEVRTLRASLANLRQQVGDDATRLDESLTRALAGRSAAAPVETDGLLSPLAETTNVAAERLTMLHRDREDRLRLEGAVRTVTQAVERAWLGLPWSWPEWSGTSLDELVALLRAPRPRETHAEWSDETPTLTAMPATERGMTPRPWERTTPISMPISAVRVTRTQALGEHGHTPVEPVAPLTARARTPSAQLPWDEWNTWGEWASAREE